MLLMILKKTALGLQVRAVSQNRPMARAMGIRSDWVDAMTFGLGSGIAGVAGVALSQWTGILWFDGLASVIIGLILIGTALWLAYETKSLLIGESANTATVQGVREILQASDSIEHVNEVLTMHMGPDFILANISVDFDNRQTAEQIEREISRLDQQIKQRFPQIKRIFIEAEKWVQPLVEVKELT